MQASTTRVSSDFHAAGPAGACPACARLLAEQMRALLVDEGPEPD